MKSRWQALFALGALAFVGSGHASFHLWQINEVFSNADGSVQYVVLRESQGASGENLWAGQTLRATNAAGVAKQLTFPSNLPSSQTANRTVLVATTGFSVAGVVPDFTIPARFIPADGGTLNFAGVDQITLPALPGDGVTAVNRNGAGTPGTPRNFAGASGTMTAQAVTSVEYYNASLDHFFISALAPDIDALDTGRIAGWTRTGLSFSVFPSQAAGGLGVTPVCRIIIPPPGDSHFFGRSPQECSDTLAKFPFMSQETPSAFFVTLPSVGVCSGGALPVYRVFSNRADANHRYTTDRSVRDAMAARGWTIEGDGPDRVVMCAPPPAGAGGGNPVPPPGQPPPPPPPPCIPGYGGCEGL